jgi:hypothetical protein
MPVGVTHCTRADIAGSLVASDMTRPRTYRIGTGDTVKSIARASPPGVTSITPAAVSSLVAG